MSNLSDKVVGSSGGGKHTGSLAQNGYWKDPDTGLIMQWGRAADPGVSSTTVTFPLAFPNALFSATASRNGGSASAYSLQITASSTTGLTVDSSYGSTDKAALMWIAIGN